MNLNTVYAILYSACLFIGLAVIGIEVFSKVKIKKAIKPD